MLLLFRKKLESFIRHVILKQRYEEEQRSEEALRVLSREDRLEYLLDNLHLRHHSQSTILTWRMKTIREKMSDEK